MMLSSSCLMTKIDFPEWLEAELQKRNWTKAELARRSGISAAQITRIFSGERKIGEEAANMFAVALQLPAEEVFQAAGLLPSRPTEQPPGFLEWMDIFLSANDDQREEMLEYARFQASRRRKKPAENR